MSRKERIAAFEAQERCFERMKERLAKEYPNFTYVVIWKGKPVVAGNDLLEVGLEFARNFGNQPAYIGKLSGEEDVTYMLSAMV